MFRGSAVAAQHQTFSAGLRVPDVGRCAGYATPRLRQRDTSGTPCVPASSTPVSSQCYSQAVPLIHMSPRCEHITPLLRELHWLRSPERIDFKLAVLVYRCLHGLSPHYLSDYFQHVAYSNRRRLRSSSSSLLLIRGTRLITVGDRAFPVVGSRLWNSLPYVVTSAPTLAVFRKRLKTYIFSYSFA